MIPGYSISRRLLHLAALMLFLPGLRADAFQLSLSKAADDIDTKYTTVGNIGLTITNFGTIGDRLNYWPRIPSCEYPRGSRIEHLYQGGIWFGAVLRNSSDSARDGQILVSTGANDRSSATRVSGEGLEFLSEGKDSLTVLSSLSADRPAGSQFSALAVSHQDMITDYNDTHTRVPATGDSIQNHNPIGLKVHQEGYAWNFPFADFFVILRYTFYNTSIDTLDSVYVGMWNNTVVHNTNSVVPRSVGYFNSTAQGFDPDQRMAYSFDFSGGSGSPPADSYIGLKLLGATPFPKPDSVHSINDLKAYTYYNAWTFRQTSGDDAYLSPTDDYTATSPFLSRYSRMTHSLPQNKIDPLRTTPQNVSYLVSTGPFRSIPPGDSLEVVFAVVCAKKAGKLPANQDTREQRENLYANAAWAQKSYQGEDGNGNNILDPGEDIARRDSVSSSEYGLRYLPDGKITRYLLPAPPRKPKVRAVVENQSVVVYWDKSNSEESTDPISGQKDFEGYRIYRSNPGDDFLRHESFVLNATLVGEFDRADDRIGYNTGFSRIRLAQPKQFPGDTVTYHYRFPPAGEEVPALNGWQYVYSISAFDQGDSVNNVPSLESQRASFRVVPGTPPSSSDTAVVTVYPNPYYVNATWDGSRERLRKIYFRNLPAHCDITVYTLAGDIVTVLNHDGATYHGEGINWFDTYGDNTNKAQFAGGEHAWDLITRNDQAISTGLYLFTVQDLDNGAVKRGKFLIVK